jgi:hypothetical protein
VVLIARWLETEGRSPWWALLLVATAGLAAAVLRTTPDAGALFFLVAALAAHARGRYGWALVLACAAVLARETSYLAALAIAADELRHRRTWRAATLVSVPLALAVGWQLYLRSVLGSAFESGLGNFSIPFVWVPQKVGTLVSGGHVWWAEVFGLLAIAATTVALVLIAARPPSWRAPELAFLAFGGMGLFLSFTVYCETWAYARALIAVPFLAVLVAENQPGGWRRVVVSSVAFFYLLAGLVMVRSELRDATTGRGWLEALGGTAAPPPGRTLYVLPVANAGGRAGAEWRTRLEVTNLATSPNTVLLELIPADSGASAPLRTTITLGAGQRRVWRNAAEENFGFSGAGALRLAPRAGPITAAGITENVAAGVPPVPLLPALTADQAIPAFTVARLSGLAHDPAPEAGVRTNVGFLNPRLTPVSVEIELFDRADRPLGKLSTQLPAKGFLQVDDVFAKVGSPRLEDGWARVHPSTPRGAFFAYASVIRGQTAGAVYVFPETEQSEATRARR